MTRSVAVMLLIFALLVVGWAGVASFALAHRPPGHFLQKTSSPEGTYTVAFYKSRTGGCSNCDVIIGRLTEKKSGQMRIFYVQPMTPVLRLAWTNGYTLSVNDSPPLDLREDTLDYRTAIRAGF